MFLALIPAVLVSGACGRDATAPAGVYGTYNLVRADGKAIPAVLLVENDYTFEVRSGSYVLRNDASFSSDVSYFETYRGWTHLSTHGFDGIFSVSGDTVTFLWPGKNETWRGVLAAGELTVVDNGITYLFRR